MCILDRVLPKSEIAVEDIINEFTKEEIEDIYPALSQMLINCLVEDLELMGYLTIEDGKATVTQKGKTKLENFKATLTAEEREALNI